MTSEPAVAEAATTPKDGQAGATSGFVIPFAWLAVCSLMVAAASIASLVVVAASEGADALATVALALAIVSFMIQIALAFGQGYSDRQQMHEMQFLHADAGKAISEMRAKIAELHLVQQNQLDPLLRAVIGALPEAVRNAATAHDISEETAQSIAEEASNSVLEPLGRSLTPSSEIVLKNVGNKVAIIERTYEAVPGQSQPTAKV